MGIVLEGQQNLSILAYMDASYGVHEDLKSHTGCVIYRPWTGLLKEHRTKVKHEEAELVALSDSTIQIIWTRNLLEEQGFKMGPATVYHSKTQNGILPTILTEDLFVARISSAFLRSVILETVQ